nr:zinc finger BED domain-containing protein 6-like [Manis javanica]
MDEQVLQEMQWAQGSCVHLTMSTAARDAVVDYVAITAHWAAVQPGSRQVVSGSPRRTAVLWVRGLPVESTQEERQRGLREKVSLWLSRSTMRPGFLVSGGCLSLEQAVRMEGYTHVPCFVSCLDSLVRNFLHHHHSIQIARAICSHFQGSAESTSPLGSSQPTGSPTTT